MARILVTDDEPGMRAMMAAVLQAHGHIVEQAATAREALAKHHSEAADVIITDLVMKEMDGTELLRRVRAVSPTTPVIAMSGNHHGTMYLNMAKLLGAEHVLPKPFDPDTLLRAVERCCPRPADATPPAAC